MHPDIVAVTRHNPKTHETVILVAHTAFARPNPNAGPTGVRPLLFEGHLDEIILEAELTHKYMLVLIGILLWRELNVF